MCCACEQRLHVAREASVGQEELFDSLVVELLRAGRALAVAVGEPIVDAFAAEGVAALADDGVLLVLLAERALDQAAVVVNLLIGLAARPAAATSGGGRGEPGYLPLQHVLLLLQPLDLYRLVARLRYLLTLAVGRRLRRLLLSLELFGRRLRLAVRRAGVLLVLVDHRLQVAPLLVLLAERVARRLALLVERLLQLVERRAQLLGHAGLLLEQLALRLEQPCLVVGSEPLGHELGGGLVLLLHVLKQPHVLVLHLLERLRDSAHLRLQRRALAFHRREALLCLQRPLLRTAQPHQRLLAALLRLVQLWLRRRAACRARLRLLEQQLLGVRLLAQRLLVGEGGVALLVTLGQLRAQPLHLALAALMLAPAERRHRVELLDLALARLLTERLLRELQPERISLRAELRALPRGALRLLRRLAVLLLPQPLEPRQLGMPRPVHLGDLAAQPLHLERRLLRLLLEHLGVPRLQLGREDLLVLAREVGALLLLLLRRGQLRVRAPQRTLE
mmetsp:Transcript_82454/g.200061  ORF Transcript_82454/g.200061 Transcript_82454/m.200061 type:complete len:506 (-) Transcript_82454:290-1807(-)